MKIKILSALILITLGSNSLAQLTHHKILTFSGYREYKLYSPKSATTNSSTIVAIHGCKQNADIFAKGSRLYEAAEKYGINLLLPEQDKNTNPYNCWNWFSPFNQARMGEPAIIIKSMNDAISKFNLNKDKFFTLGMSSGAAMANILMNCYPTKFKAAASHSGVPYSATSNALLAGHVLEYGMSTTPYLTTLKGIACGLCANTKVPALIIQGRDDKVVASLNAADISEQFTIYNSYSYSDLDYSKEETLRNDGYNMVTKSWSDKMNRVIVKEVMIDNLNHAWSGGNESYEYNDKNGPDATRMIIDFFKENGL